MTATPLARALDEAESRGITPALIIKRFQISRYTLSSWRSGQRTPTLKDAIALAKLVERPVEELWPQYAGGDYDAGVPAN